MKKGALVVLVVVVVTAALTLVPRVAVDLRSKVFVSPNPPGYTLRTVKATKDRGHANVNSTGKFKPLTAEQVEGVEKFLFFTGYPRSGHSIVGSFLDAHPNIVLSYAYYLFRKLLDKDSALLQNKTHFFNTIYSKSYHYSLVSMKVKKGYSLDVPGLWGGKFNGQLKVIGDKSALPTTKGYSQSSPAYFKERYDFLQRSVGIPLVGIHVVRNPFDMISTSLLYDDLGYSWKSRDKGEWSSTNQYRNDVHLQAKIDFFFDKAKSVQEMVPHCKMKVLDVHSEDVVKNPKKELKRICEFLEVDCSEEYLQKCEDKCFREVSRTRDKVFWPLHLRKKVEEKIAMFSFFRGYTFEEDLYNP